MNNHRLTFLASCLALCTFPAPLFAATTATVDIGLTILVLLVAAASVYLPLAAYSHWTGAWRKAALAPLLLLLLWVVLVLAHRAVDPSAHPRWQIELFIAAMAIMVYMVALFTIKSILNKADG